MEESNTEKSYDYMQNLEFDAYSWHAELITSDDFKERSEYQKKFLLRQYDKLHRKITGCSY